MRPFFRWSVIISVIISACLCTCPTCEAQNETITPIITYTTLHVSVIIDTVAYISLAQYIPGWWVQRTLQQGGIGGLVPVNVTTYLSVGLATPAWATNITQQILSKGIPDVVIMLCLDTVVPFTAGQLEPLGVPIIIPAAPSPSLFKCGTNYVNQPPCRKPNTRRYQYAHGIEASMENYFEPFIALLKLKKAHSVAYLLPVRMDPTGPPPPTIYSEWGDSIRSSAFNNKISWIIIPVRFPLPLANEIPGVIQQLRDANIDAFMGATGCDVWLPYFKAVDLNFKAMIIARCIDAPFPPATDPKELSRYIVAPAQWDPRLTGR